MEKIITNLHMDRIKCRDEMQFTIDEDKNISERSADIVKILREDGRVIIEEVRAGKDQAEIRGKLKYTILYLSEDENRKLCRINGEIGFEEKMRAEGMEVSDSVKVQAVMEDIRSSCINSRKVNIKAIIGLTVNVWETYDEEVISDMEVPGLEKKKEEFTVSSVCISRGDIFRVKEETELPQAIPPVEEVLWKSIQLKKWEARPLEDSISVQGEVDVFLLYRALAEEEEIRYYDTSLPFSGNLECGGSHSDMLSNIVPYVVNQDINVKQDYDGEDRILEAEMVLELPIHLYETKQVEVIRDVYGKNEIVTPVYRKAEGQKKGDKQQGKIKLCKAVRIPASAPKILQICYTDSNIISVSPRKTDHGEKIEGVAEAVLLYVTDSKEQPFYTLKEEIPFEYILDTDQADSDCRWDIFCLIQECKTILLDGEQAEIKMSLAMELQPVYTENWEFLEDIEKSDIEVEVRNKLPSMVVYRPSSRESLWDIGKKYFVSTEMIKKINQLEKEEVEEGEKLLLVR